MNNRFINVHWNYYLSLEADVEGLSRYIEFSEENFRTYSIEIAKLFLATCSEIDVVMKLLCRALKPEKGAETMKDYWSIIENSLPRLLEANVNCQRYGMELKPWALRGDEKHLDWWKWHNLVKHKRGDNFSQANLGNLLNALAALYLVNIYCNHQIMSSESKYPFELRDSHSVLEAMQLKAGRNLFVINEMWANTRGF